MSGKCTDGKRLFYVHPNAGSFLKTLLLNLLLFVCFRVAFFLKYHPLFAGISFFDIGASFLRGFRFDLAVVFQINSLLFLILFFPGRWVLSRWFQTAYKYLVSTLLTLQAVILCIDLEYYGFVHRHLAMDIINTRNDLPSMISLAMSQYPLQLAAIGCSIGAMWYATTRFLQHRSTDTYPAVTGYSRFVSPALHMFLIAALTVVCWRGGLQSKPLRVSNAFPDDNIVLGHLSLNGIYTMSQALYKSGMELKVNYDYDMAVANVRAMLEDGNGTFVNGRYPLLRHTPGKKTAGTPPNVVIFIMESWSGDSVGALGSDKGLTPNFDALARDGYLFTDLFSVGQRSLDAVVSILCSFPSFSQCTVVGKVYEQNKVIGIGTILKQKGYETLFICGAHRGSMGFDAFSRKIGFDRYIAKEDFPLPGKCFDGSWGVYDEYAFARADSEFRKMKKPFLAVMYTLNPHPPYKTPDGFQKIAAGENAEYYNALNYCDSALGQYFKQARGADYFKNTLFVIVADHCEGHHEKSVIDSFRIPCLFYFPGKIKPRRDPNVASQLDILPGIVDTLGIDCTHAALGSSPFGRRGGTRNAFIGCGNLFGWVNEDSVLLQAGDKPMALYEWRRDKLQHTNLLAAEGNTVQAQENKLLSFLKVTQTVLTQNQIAP